MAYWKVIGFIYCLPGWGLAQIQIDTSFSENELVEDVFIQSGIEVNSISYQGSYQAIGLFSGELDGLPISKGIILSTGKATGAVGPNRSQESSTVFFRDGDTKLSKLSGRDTHDAAVLEFTFFPTHNTIAFEYLFASEEYPEYVNKGFNDVFAFILTDYVTKKERNLAVIPGTNSPVHIDNINATRNSEWFIANTDKAIPLYQHLEYDGLTKVLSAEASVIPNRPYRIKLAIADVDDGKLDSGVILREKSFRSFDQPVDTLKAAPAMVYFSHNSSELSESAQSELRSLAQRMLAEPPTAIRVIGHTDAVGSNDYNQQLSQRRVQSVVSFLASLGLRGKVKLYRQSRGETQPLAPNTNKVGRARNRRVEVRIQ